MENTWRPHSLFIRSFSVGSMLSSEQSTCFGASAFKGSHHQKSVPSSSPLAPDCYLAFRWGLAAPMGSYECACQQECIGGNRGRWRMVRSCCCYSLCVKMSSLIQPPPLPLPKPSLCLLSLFVSEMIPSVMSKATLSYPCCLGNQRWERQRLKAFMGVWSW